MIQIPKILTVTVELMSTPQTNLKYGYYEMIGQKGHVKKPLSEGPIVQGIYDERDKREGFH